MLRQHIGRAFSDRESWWLCWIQVFIHIQICKGEFGDSGIISGRGSNLMTIMVMEHISAEL